MLAITPLFNLILKKRFYKRKNFLSKKKINLPHQNLFILSDQTFLITSISLSMYSLIISSTYANGNAKYKYKNRVSEKSNMCDSKSTLWENSPSRHFFTLIIDNTNKQKKCSFRYMKNIEIVHYKVKVALLEENL